MKVRMQKYIRCGLGLIIGWVLVSLGTAIPAGFAETQVTEEWVARYNGTGDGGDIANALAVDDSGNVYVTGSSVGSGTFNDYATVKYGTDSTELWVARYDGTGNGDDVANAIAVDRKGNVYVTGQSLGSGTIFDYATVKYDKDGNQKWEARYDGTGNGDDVANALAVDDNGNVYVTGWSVGSSTFNDYATVKYASDHKQGDEPLWVARYNGSGGDDVANAIAVDRKGNVYVTGFRQPTKIRGVITPSEYATVKYDKDGNEEWVARYDGPLEFEGRDKASAISVDGDGNVYVTGESWDSGTGLGYATVKYDSTNGEQLWEARYDGLESSAPDKARAIAVDKNGDVYVTGESSGGSGTSFDYATVKYDTDGNEEWVARYNGPGNKDDFANAIAVDDDGNVYVTGKSWGSVTKDDYATVKYNQNTPPVAVAGEDQTICPQGASPVQVTLDGSGSFDPDGDPLTYKWTGPLFPNVTGIEPIITVPIPPGISNATLVVNDGTVDSDPDTVIINVQDFTAPDVEVKLKKKKGYLRIMFSATDNCDADPDIVALLKVDSDNGVSVTNGQIVKIRKLRHKKRFKVNTGDDDSSSDDSSDDEDGIKFEGTSFTLEVIATDDAGNVGTGSDTFVFPSRHHGDSKSHDDKSSDDKSNDDN